MTLLFCIVCSLLRYQQAPVVWLRSLLFRLRRFRHRFLTLPKALVGGVSELAIVGPGTVFDVGFITGGISGAMQLEDPSRRRLYFQRAWCELVDAAPHDIRWMRGGTWPPVITGERR